MSKILTKVSFVAVLAAVSFVTAVFLMQLPAAAQGFQDLPSHEEVRKAVPSVTLVTEPIDGQALVVTVKEGEYFLLKIAPVDFVKQEIWFFGDSVPSSEKSVLSTGWSEDRQAVEVKGMFHGKGSHRVELKYGIFSLNPYEFMHGEPRPYSKIMYLTVVVE